MQKNQENGEIDDRKQSFLKAPFPDSVSGRINPAFFTIAAVFYSILFR